MKKYTEEELKQVFENNSNCYADSDEVVMAMDKERFIETLKELKILPIQNVSVSLFDEALRVMRDLAEHQNGAPLIRHEEEYNKTMTEVWDFLEANET